MESTSQEDLIRRRAYELWEREGSPDGRADEFWDQAAASIASESPAASETGETGEQEAAPLGNTLDAGADGVVEEPLGRS